MGEPSETAVKTLFADSRNLCFFHGCEEKLTNRAWRQVNAEIAHIRGERPGSARFDEHQPEGERQGYDNLMLLCPKHHKLIDRLEPHNFPSEVLVEMKEKHLEHRPSAAWATDVELLAFVRSAIELAAHAIPPMAGELSRDDEAPPIGDIDQPPRLPPRPIVGNRVAVNRAAQAHRR